MNIQNENNIFTNFKINWDIFSFYCPNLIP